jgi:hypothetical protein
MAKGVPFGEGYINNLALKGEVVVLVRYLSQGTYPL